MLHIYYCVWGGGGGDPDVTEDQAYSLDTCMHIEGSPEPFHSEHVLYTP